MQIANEVKRSDQSDYRIVVLLSGSGSNLQALIDSGLSSCIQLVVSNKANAFGIERAKKAGIATAVVPHAEFDGRKSFESALIQEIDKVQPDLVVLAGFMRILTAHFVTKFCGRLLNIHPSLLPKYQGLNTHQRAIDAGDPEAGASIHLVTEELDGGPVLAQARVPILDGDSAETLAKRVLTREHKLYAHVVRWFVDRRMSFQSADSTKVGEKDTESVSQAIMGEPLLDGKPFPEWGYDVTDILE